MPKTKNKKRQSVFELAENCIHWQGRCIDHETWNKTMSTLKTAFKRRRIQLISSN